jgi:uncharacterized membrane protein YuzA (DUF378 family)
MSSQDMVDICKIALVVAAIGAINWYTCAVMDFNVVSYVAGTTHPKIMLTKTERILYTVVGVAGAIVLYCFFNDQIRITA